MQGALSQTTELIDIRAETRALGDSSTKEARVQGRELRTESEGKRCFKIFSEHEVSG